TIAEAADFARDIRQYHIGSIIIFDHDVQLDSPRNVVNPSQLRDLIAGLQAVSPTRLLVAADQEGGQVAKLKEKYGFHKSESPQALGERDDVDYTRAAALVMAGDLKSVGINLNLAPVVDVAVNPQGPIARQGRSFSADPDVVIRHARAFVDAHRELGILTTLKHFPGHGSSLADSHVVLPDVTQT